MCDNKSNNNKSFVLELVGLPTVALAKVGGSMLLTLLAQTTDYSAADAAAATAALGTATAVAGGLVIFWIIFWILAGILWLVALIDVIRRNFANSNDKVLWLVLVIVLPLLGPILYFIIGKKKGSITGGSTPA